MVHPMYSMLGCGICFAVWQVLPATQIQHMGYTACRGQAVTHELDLLLSSYLALPVSRLEKSLIFETGYCASMMCVTI